jgi:hypothetical protein
MPEGRGITAMDGKEKMIAEEKVATKDFKL